MPDPRSLDVTDYVRTTARFLELPLSDAQVERVAEHLARTRELVSALRATPLLPEDELAEIFQPAPFPAQDPT
ncbi:MAG TPA: AtzG-like protein [Rhizobacter sp.]|nr:AtzG-like protein [Rhizobacter sp.]